MESDMLLPALPILVNQTARTWTALSPLHSLSSP